ncbi:MAG: hypothetical protein EX285_00160 [Thaumarchaeota archaeon]|nr:hypothetical protein [Nitrososphaerota archaeon]
MEFRIDGSYGEGGGQILRTSVTLATIMKKAVEIVNIRAKRSNPGLRPQHVNAIKAMASLCNAYVENVYVGSNMIKFIPKDMQSNSIKIDVGTAGSVTMILQTIIPAASLSGRRVEVELRGGTDVRWSTTLDYLAAKGILSCWWWYYKSNYRALYKAKHIRYDQSSKGGTNDSKCVLVSSCTCCTETDSFYSCQITEGKCCM